MSKHKVNICGLDTSKLLVLKNSEMLKLFYEYKNNHNLIAKEKLINGNLKLVLSILKKYNNRDNMDDLFQVGCIGLIKAIDNFDLSYNVKFSTYAVPMILGEVKRYIRDNNSLRIARSIKDTSYKIAKEREKYILENEKEPTDSEICKRLGISEYDYALALNSNKDAISMFEPIYSDGGDTIYLCDQLSDDKELYSIEDKLCVKDAYNRLKDKEKYILESRYFYGKSQVELSHELGISQAQISRLEKSGIDNIKKKVLKFKNVKK